MTFDAFEQRLHDVLTRDADRAPNFALTVADIRRLAETPPPEAAPADSPRPRHRLRWTAAAAAVVVGAGIGAAGIIGGGSTTAFASWVSSPQPISSSQIVAVDRACHGTSPVIVDRRGNSAYAVYSDGTSWTDCLQTIPGKPHDKGLPEGWMTNGSLAAVQLRDPSSTEPLVLLSAKAPEGSSINRSPVTWVSGRYAPEVTRIEIQTSSGTVIPTMHDGLYAAWWPGNDGASGVVRAYGSNGQVLSQIDQWNCATASYPLAPRIQAPGQPTVGGCS